MIPESRAVTNLFFGKKVSIGNGGNAIVGTSFMVKTGLDRLFSDPSLKLKGKRLGILAHPSSVNGQLLHILEIFSRQKGFKIIRLFGPEHGIWGTAQDMIDVASAID